MGPDSKFAHAPADRRVASPPPHHAPAPASPSPQPAPTPPDEEDNIEIPASFWNSIPTSQPDLDSDIHINTFDPVHTLPSDIQSPPGDGDELQATLPADLNRRKAPPDPKGTYLYGTQSHPNWTLLETERDARIAVYINK